MNTEDMRQHFEPDGSPRRLDGRTDGERCSVAPGSAARCPKCNGVGYYVRTRYFDGEAADVWECQSPQCTSFGLLWHVSRPYSDAENMARATQILLGIIDAAHRATEQECTCGGNPADDPKCCPACKVYHRLEAAKAASMSNK